MTRIFTRRRSKPWSGVGIDWTHPLSPGLAGAWIFNDYNTSVIRNLANPAKDAVLQSAATLTDTTYTSSPHGLAVSHTNAHGNNGYRMPAIRSTATFTFATWVKLTTTGGYQNLLSNGATLGFWTLSGKLDAYLPGDKFSNTAILPGVWVNWVFVANNSGGTFYLNGVPDGTATSISTFDANSMLCDTGGLEVFTGSMSHQYLWVGRAFTHAEVQSLYHNPWQIFQPATHWTTAPVWTGGVAISAGKSISAAGTSLPPSYAGSCLASSGRAIAAAGTVAVPSYSGDCTVSPRKSVSSGGVGSVPLFSGSASASSHPLLQSPASSAVPAYNGICNISARHVAIGVSSQSAEPVVYIGSTTLVAGHAIADAPGVNTYVVMVYEVGLQVVTRYASTMPV